MRNTKFACKGFD